MSSTDARVLWQGRLEIIRPLGQGGMGAVFEAFDRETQSAVAVKHLRLDAADALQHFKDEFREFHDLAHPNLVHLGELFEDAGEWYFTMELIQGRDFLHYVRAHEQAGFMPGLDESDPGFFMREASFVVDPSGAPALLARSRASLEESALQGSSSQGSLSGIDAFRRAITTPGFNEARLRSTIRQLAEVVDFLHSTGKIHRDIKPSNILVTSQGRLVLLDFGFVLGIAPENNAQSLSLAVVGTVEYMAPEQAVGQSVGPKADWYAIGAILYQALTNHVPVAGTPFDVLVKKQTVVPLRPKDIVPYVPADLDALCVELLRLNPDERPDGSEVLSRLAGPGQKARSSSSTLKSQEALNPLFIGREEELSVLRNALSVCARRKDFRGVIVQGESGLGKSALIRRFASQIRTTHPEAVVLTGRCYERETVPYKAVDGVVDALSRYMSRLPTSEAEALLPLRGSLLADAFPTLKRIEAFARMRSTHTQGPVDPQEQRTRLFAAMRELLTRLGERRTLVLVIDDLHWADVDSLSMLSELLRPPEAPSLLFMTTTRYLERAGQEPRITSLASLPGIETLELGRLSLPDAQALATAYLGSHSGHPSTFIDAIVKEAQGHPLFVQELARHALAGGDRTLSAASMRLDDVLKARIDELPPVAKRVLEVVVVAGAPTLQTIIAKAAEVDPTEFARGIVLLRGAHLVQTASSRGQRMINPYHDRVRETLTNALGGSTRRAHHLALAEALESSSAADPTVLALHFREAGDNAKTVKYSLLAAKDAEDVFAFERAASLYREVLDLLPSDAPSRTSILLKLADAHANEGRGDEAARVYEEAIPGVDHDKAFELKRIIAEQLLLCGHLQAGQRALEVVLGTVGIHRARTEFTALLSSLVTKLWLRWRGVAFHRTAAESVDHGSLEVLDCLWAAVRGYMFINPPFGMDFQARYAMLALRIGEPFRVARALAAEASTSAATARTPSAYALALDRLKAAETIAESLGDTFSVAHVKSHGSVVRFTGGELKEAYRLAVEAETLYTEQCVGVTWYLVVIRRNLIWTTYYLGELSELQRRASAYFADADRRGDIWALAAFGLGVAALAPVFGDDLDSGRKLVEDTMRRLPKTRFGSQDLHALIALTHMDLYEGKGAQAWERVQTALGPLKKSMLLHVRYVYIDTHHLLGRSALSYASTLPSGSAEHKRLLQAAARSADALSRLRFVWADGLASMIRGGIASLQGRGGRARELAHDAASAFDACSTGAYAAAARWREGALEGGEAGESLTRASREFMTSKQVKRPEAMLEMLAPGYRTQ